MSEEEQDVLYQHTSRIRAARAVEAERTSQAPPLPSTEMHIEHEDEERQDEVVVKEYDTPLEGGIRGITKIPSRLTNADALESLGWRNFELKVCGRYEYLAFADLNRTDSSKCNFPSNKAKSNKF